MTKTKQKILGLALSVSMIASCFTGMSIPASADGESTYTITIPSALTVTDKGWNSIGNISASGTLADGKKLTVSAASANSWALTSTSDSVSYTLKNASTDNAATTSWEFTKEQLSTGATQAIGIDVSDYSTKPAGTYTDTVTFTASVEDAAPVLTYIEVGKKRDHNLDNVKFYYIPGETYRQAVQNHGKENGSNWRIYEDNSIITTINWNGYGDLYINGDNDFRERQGSCELTLDSVVNPNKTYTHDITIWDWD